MIGHWKTFKGTSLLNSNLGIEDIYFGLADSNVLDFKLQILMHFQEVLISYFVCWKIFIFCLSKPLGINIE